MEIHQIRQFRKKHRIFNALLMRNPVLVMGLDLPFIIAAATSLKNAAAMAIVMLMIHVGTMLAGIATCRKLPYWLRMLVNACVSTVIMMVAQALVAGLFKGISNSLGMYLYLMAVNGMTIFQASGLGRKAKIYPVVTGAVLNTLGFALVAAITGVIREYMGSGTLWGIPVYFPVKITALQLPFAGFIVVGFLLALSRLLNKLILSRMMREHARRNVRHAKIYIDSVETID